MSTTIEQRPSGGYHWVSETTAEVAWFGVVVVSTNPSSSTPYIICSCFITVTSAEVLTVQLESERWV